VFSLIPAQSLLKIMFVAMLLVISFSSQAEPLNGSLAAMPLSAEIDNNGEFSGAYVDLIRAIDRIMGEQTNLLITPFKRSIRNLTSGSADYHIPLIEPPNASKLDLPYAFSTETLFQVAFVLYSNKEKPIDTSKLGQYTIATELAHTGFFPFPVDGLSCLSCALKMVESERIDGFIFAQNEMDPFIKTFGLKKIHRQLYKNFDVKVLIPKGEQGKRIDKYFSVGIKYLKARGEYEHLLEPLLTPYKDWQP